MAIRFADRVKVRSSSFGTGDFTLGQVVPGFQSFSVIGDGNQAYYCIVDAIGNWELGLGTYDLDSTQEVLTRDTVIDSSAGGLKINFPRGGKTVFVTIPSTISQTVADSVLNTLAGPKGDKGDPGVSITYEHRPEYQNDGALLRLEASDSTVSDIKLAEGANVTIEKTDPSTITISATSSLAIRETPGVATGAFANGSTLNTSITGFKGYLLYKVQVSHACRVRIYTDSASRTADAARAEGATPAVGSGLVAEVITTGAATRIITPVATGFSNEAIPTTAIPVSITNKSGGINNITVNLTLIQIEQ
jgi:hypothetical protein